MGIELQEALEVGLISKEVYSSIPKSCIYGKKLILSDSLRSLSCCDKNCKCVLVNRIVKILDYIGIKVTDNVAKSLIDCLELKSPYQVFELPEVYKTSDKLNAIIGIDNIIKSVNKALMKEYSLCDIFAMSGIDEISSVADDLCAGFCNGEEFFSELHRAQIALINDRLGVNNNECAALAVELYNSIKNIEDELIYCESILKHKESSKYFSIVFADSVVPSINKKEYIEHLRNKFQFNCCYTTTVSSTTDIVIRNGSNINNKIEVANNINIKNSSELVNNNEIDVDDIGKNVYGELKPVGYKILICSIEELDDKIAEIKEKSRN